MKYVPPLGAEDENAPYIDGNPEFGIEGSPVPAPAIEHPQREIVEVIAQAGLTPNGDDMTQLWQALLEVIRVKVPLATLERPGIVQPDGMGCTVNAAGLLSILPDMRWMPTVKYDQPVLRVGPDGKLYLWLAASGPGVAGVEAKVPGAVGSESYWLDYAASLTPEIPAGVPRGAVCPFYKVTFAGSDGRRPIFWGATAPDEGWVIADGGSDGAGGNVPNLKDRMIMGAGGSYAAGATGGAATHSHSVSGSAGYTTLSSYEMPNHSHSGDMMLRQGGSQANFYYPMADKAVVYSTGAAGSSGSHTHGLSASAATANGLPPFYALAQCVKI